VPIWRSHKQQYGYTPVYSDAPSEITGAGVRVVSLHFLDGSRPQPLRRAPKERKQSVGKSKYNPEDEASYLKRYGVSGNQRKSGPTDPER
jgi:hypothetical protein